MLPAELHSQWAAYFYLRRIFDSYCLAGQPQCTVGSDQSLTDRLILLQTPRADQFLHSLRIRTNSGREYTSRRGWATFDKQGVSRSEITVVLKLPDLRDADKMRDFLRRTWVFARELGHNLV